MGCVRNVGYDEFPRQGGHLGRRVEVCFNYDATRTLGGEVVRDDAEEPGVEIIRLDDGRYVLTTECQYRVPPVEGKDAHQ